MGFCQIKSNEHKGGFLLAIIFVGLIMSQSDASTRSENFDDLFVSKPEDIEQNSSKLLLKQKKTW
ncbi:hypothetical protein [Wolbachia endosymbiont of Chironomus riparius]|uniref:hypothetical protein n=1 Tax=Wolbachia endosymbiont of Chironomus riparius TaxID=2883238 RepID=UPI00209FD785|nr:hypothetical protein [Wolbachia endosymbiont of Chironomus riparius]